MEKNIGFQFLLLSLSLLLIIPIGAQSIFAEEIVSIQRTVDVDKESLTDTLASLEKYPQILPDYIQSSKLIGDNTTDMKIGLEWITINADVKFVESNNKVALEVISGDLKGTKLYVEISEKTNTKTGVSAEIHLKMSWYMEILTSWVSEKDIKSMLNTSLDGLVEHTKNPTASEKPVEEEKGFCIFSLCF